MHKCRPVPSECISECQLHYNSPKTHNSLAFELTVLTFSLRPVNYTIKFQKNFELSYRHTRNLAIKIARTEGPTTVLGVP